MRKNKVRFKVKNMLRALRRFVNKLTGKNAIIFFIVIFLICVVSICLGIYSQYFYKYSATDPLMLGIHIGSKKSAQEYAELRASFSDLFDNKLHEYDTKELKVNKITNGKSIVYTNYSIQNEDENYYNVDVNIPRININNDITKKMNSEIESKYYDEANNIMRTAKSFTIYKVSYVAYINNGALSVAIKESLKTGNKPETVTISTYNYSIPDEKELSLNDLITLKGVTKKEVQESIDNTIETAYNNALAIEQEYGSTYKRDLDSDIYKIDEAKTYFLTDDGYVYIVYAYGEYAATNEIDIVIF